MDIMLYMCPYGGIMQWSDPLLYQSIKPYFKLPKHVIFVVFKIHKDLIAETKVLNDFNDFLKPLKSDFKRSFFRILKWANS